MSDLAPVLPVVTTYPDAAVAHILLRQGASGAAAAALSAWRGLDLPPAGHLSAAASACLLWVGPDRFVAVRERGGDGLAHELAAALDGLAYVVEASSSRAVVGLAGEGVTEALGRILPIDLHPRVFTAGCVAATVAAHVPVLVWRPAVESLRLACPSSLATCLRRQLVLAGFGP